MKSLKWMTIALLILVLAACGGGASSNAGQNTEGQDTAATGEETEATGGNLRVALAATPKTLDPIAYTAVYESNVMKSIFDTLVQYNDDLSEIQPALATEWEVSDDLKTYTFTLRDDVSFQPGEFQDGRPMTAEDVKYSLERSSKESAMNRLRNVESVEVIGDNQVAVHMTEPYSALLAVLTDMGNAIVPKEEVEGHGDAFGQNPVGTGPFAFSDWAKDDFIKVTASETYWGDKPNLDGVEWSFISDGNMRANALRAGDIDVATEIAGQARALVQTDDKLKFLSTPGLSIEYLAFNMTEGPTSDLKVRQAMQMATNVEDIVKGAYQFGGATPARLPLPEASWGYDEAAAGKIPGYDVDAAKALLAETDYADGFSTELYVIEKRVPHATVFQTQMKENLNIDVEIKTLEWGTFSDTVSKGQAPLYIMGWSWYPDPEFFLYQMLHSNQIGALGNGGGYSNPEVDSLLTRATSETADQGERAELYKQALNIISEDLPHIDMTQVEITVGTTTKVNDYKVSPDGSITIVGNGTNVSLSE
ncbi:ABC transporter substrate-binding protein [Aureibacillus halotolerans]|uniref:Peptide/nickel transport system substrate-binding protein n=1 Tax=Aureibacillus halotolerans TaxID=1508390 RepID=A0A4V3D4M2_9BACI|nr:ABC transporter substrate-binding protein [Aureibacillus halotolerans]TDQ36547.1 peptide/nickel transport system substrate-binding protein [Aureibacillus halotolerans]